ncbi:MAG: lactate utilization protein [Deltaproteobacteria bacterium]|nr:lactate utilization protein [Deltaproteobacteria bacterium]
MDPVMQWYMEDRGKRAVEALKKREFNALYVETQLQAKEIVLQEIPPGVTVGIGGSVTIRGMKVLDDLRARGNKVIDHWVTASLFSEENFQLRRAQQTCDVFLSSTNAITLEGQLVNIDGGGNRVNALGFGPQKAIVVAGVNKIVPDLESALRRIREITVPLNCRRINSSPPCIAAGKCVDCRVPLRVCRITTIIEWKPPFFSDYLIVIVGENLGY